MLTPEDKLLVLQRFVDNFSNDLLAVRAVVADGSTPEAAQRFLIGGLNYALDALDMFPDHFKGIGVADDAIVLRLAAKLAFAAGSKHPTVEALAIDANLVIALFDDLAGPLERLVGQFPEREVRGRSAAKILASKDVRAAFDADIAREAKRQVAAPVAGKDTPERTVIELKKMLEAALKRAGLV